MQKVLAEISDTNALEDAIRHHSEILDLLSNEMMAIKNGDRNDDEKQSLLGAVRMRAEYHRDVVDRLTDVIEQNDRFKTSLSANQQRQTVPLNICRH